MDTANQPFSYGELLQRLEDLGVAMRTYADSLLNPGNGDAQTAPPAHEELAKTGD